MKKRREKHRWNLFDALGRGKLPHSFIQFTKMHVLFNIAVALSSTFVSTFLLGAGAPMSTVTLYYIFSFLGELIGYLLVMSLTGRVKLTLLSRFGLLLYASAYLSLLILQENTQNYYPMVALVSCIGAAFYWLPYHFYCGEYTDDLNRQVGLSYVGFFTNLVLLITPLLSGLIIRQLHGITGYIVSFSLTVVAFIGAALLTRTMPSQPTGVKKNAMLALIREELRVSRTLLILCLSHFFYGIRDGVYMYFFTAILFEATGSELVVGVNSALRSVMAMLMLVLIRRYYRPQKHGPVLVACFLLPVVLPFGMMPWGSEVWFMLLLSLTDMALQTYNTNSLSYVSYGVIDLFSNLTERNRRAEINALRIEFLNLGRILGLTLPLLLVGVGEMWLLVLLNALAVPSAFLMNRAVRKLLITKQISSSLPKEG